MSYEIIRSIKVKDNKVLINCASNNVRPHSYEEGEAVSLSQILQEKGRESLDIEILNVYVNGSFQGGNNKYTRALKVLYHFPEYHRFDWRANWEESKKNRDSKEYFELLARALKTSLPKEKFIICKQYRGELVYGKRTKNYMKWQRERNKATKYNYRIDAESVKFCFRDIDDWKVIKHQEIAKVEG